jgi:PHD/YefM family antitoxin component YafN of YafNO toxin-antitoxin module
MNIINATVLRNNLSDAISEIQNKKEYLLIAKRGKISSALVSLDLLEDLMELSDKRYLASIKKARLEYEKGDIFAHEEVFGKI